MKIFALLVITLTMILPCYGQTAEEYYKTGIALLENYDTNRESWENFTKAIEIDPDYKEAWFSRGKLSFQPYELRYADYSKAIQLDSNYKEAYFWRGKLTASVDSGDYQSAISDFTRAIELGLHTKDIFYERAFMYYQLNNYNLAITEFSKVIEMDSEFNLAYYYRGYSRVIQGQKEIGCTDLQKAGELGLPNAYEVIKELCQ